MSTYATDITTGDGSTTVYTLSFPYISRADVEVARLLVTDDDAAEGTELTLIDTGEPTGDQWRWESDNSIRVGTAPTTAQKLKIKRVTPETDQIVEWDDGSYLIAEDLNTSDLQWLYLIQEKSDWLTLLEDKKVAAIQADAPITVDNSDPLHPTIGADLITTSEAEEDPDVSGDTQLLTPGATDRIYANIVGTGADYPGTGNAGKHGKIRLLTSGDTPDMFYWDSTQAKWIQVQTQGTTGSQGPKGDPASLQDPPAEATTVALKADGSLGDATATTTQDSDGKMFFSFGIPAGQSGPASTVPGPKPGLQDTAATATNVANKGDGTVGDATAAVNQDGDGDLQFQFGIPVGEQGPKGDVGPTSTVPGPPPGLQDPATSVSNVAVNDDGSAGNATASVTADSSKDLKFTFGIPVGATGAKGDRGETGTGVTYKGKIDATADAEPVDPDNGDYYVNTGDGSSSWTGVGTVDSGDRLIWNNTDSKWDDVPLPDATAVNLSYTASATDGKVMNSSGTDATVPLVNNTNAGLMSPSQNDKLSDIEGDAQVNVKADWASSSGDSQILNKPSWGTGLSSTKVGDVTTVNLIPPTSTVIGGVKAGTGISIDAAGNISVDGGEITTGVNLAWDQATHTVTNTAGNNAQISAATTSNLGLISVGGGLSVTVGGALSITSRTLWGQAYDGTADVDGDITSAAAMTVGTSAGDLTLDADGTIILNKNTSVDGHLTLTEVGADLVLTGDDDSDTERDIRITAPTNDEEFAADYTLTLPPTAGAADEVLTTDGSGNLSWSTGGGNGTTEGGENDEEIKDLVFQENEMVVRVSYTIGANGRTGRPRSALSAGPIVVNDDVVVTIPNGSSWVIL
jgi:hypothetical protein